MVEVLALPNDDSVDVTEGIWKLGFGFGVTLIPCLLGVLGFSRVESLVVFGFVGIGLSTSLLKTSNWKEKFIYGRLNNILSFNYFLSIT